MFLLPYVDIGYSKSKKYKNCVVCGTIEKAQLFKLFEEYFDSVLVMTDRVDWHYIPGKLKHVFSTVSLYQKKKQTGIMFIHGAIYLPTPKNI